MKTEGLKQRLRNACRELLAVEEELTLIDSKFGDADHGLTMHKVAETILGAVDGYDGSSIKGLLEEVAKSVGMLNGGSAIPLWNSWLQGMADAADDSDETDLEGLKKIFAGGFDEFDFMSGAKVGDKTMMDAMAPANEALMSTASEDELFEKAAHAAREGAEKTKEYTARFGRAKSFGEKTLGTVDAGALSLASFFKGLAER